MAGDALSLDIAGLTAAYRDGRLHPSAVVEQLFAAIAADTRGLNAFCLLDRAAAEREAEASGRRWREGRPLSVLDGVPVSIKDLVNVAGWPTRRGSLGGSEEPVPQDAPGVTPLRAGGAVLFGKTTTTEFGWTVGSSNPQAGTTRNPAAPGREVGGSSSGAAAQVAAAWGPLALGSDAGGSVRLPASWTGTVGFKPSFGAIPLAPASAFAEFAHLGTFTRSVADAALAMQVLSRADARDPSSLFVRGEAPADRPLRIAWALSLGSSRAVQPDVAGAVRALVRRLADAGHTVIDWPESTNDRAEDMWRVWTSRIHESFVDWSDTQRARLSPGLQAAYEQGATQSAAELARARARLRAMADALAQRFTDIDLLVTPSTPGAAPPLGEVGGGAWFEAVGGFTYPFNLSQQPALSLPLGTDAEGAPFGVQLVGPRFHDAAVLRAGARVEALLAQGR
ncbi:MAG: amidase [Hydrogenophaga sp.]|uniref:amidase family protein n=1 Tax=Hydrogenophaga sp. TaxID=1904254 RepID=UPI0016B99990|nr:amidase family protein [Hydrogenophaga sp.]NIM43899.1 amidase [Hydrogenophaga sp.]NIN28965.1 amidase [Hydrogenophaga sp.]NIN33424.1 amidase [Hydrogenophaga sp.]NIN58099.1 amidase [Hydrogenophaga sp.]NIO54397.1 amidase [Hydrogenophaga sp.]